MSIGSSSKVLALAGLAVTFAAGYGLLRATALARAEASASAAARELDAASGDGARSLALESLEAELASERARTLELEAQVRDLEAELGFVQTERLEREMNFLDFTSTVAALDPDGSAGRFVRELLSETPGSVEPSEQALSEAIDPEREQERAVAERSAAMQVSLRALLAAEWVRGLDLLDIGLLGDGWTGPVVFRLVDDHGRLTGNLFAERLRLEGSSSGRVVTLVLEEGSESHGGERVPFTNGVRRIVLPGVDPGPFHEALPELFPAEDAFVAPDDAGIDLEALKTSLNRLLEEDATGEIFRLRYVGGVRGGILRDVHLSVRDRDGTTLRHVFADSLRIVWLDEGVELLLEDGVTMRGDERAPFLDGRYRVFLPRARREAWEALGVPGGRAEPADEGTASE